MVNVFKYSRHGWDGQQKTGFLFKVGPVSFGDLETVLTSKSPPKTCCNEIKLKH